MDLSWLRRRLPDACPGESLASLLPRLEGMLALTDTAIQSVRRIATELRPILLEELGLAPAVEWQAQEFQRRTDVPACRLCLESVSLKGQEATALFRILQEAVTNVSRHAAATEVRLVLREEINAVVLEVTDNGVGISHTALNDRQSLGLLGMHERAAHVGGTLHVERLPQAGTRVVVRVPSSEVER